LSDETGSRVWTATYDAFGADTKGSQSPDLIALVSDVSRCPTRNFGTVTLTT